MVHVHDKVAGHQFVVVGNRLRVRGRLSGSRSPGLIGEQPRIGVHDTRSGTVDEALTHVAEAHVHERTSLAEQLDQPFRVPDRWGEDCNIRPLLVPRGQILRQHFNAL